MSSDDRTDDTAHGAPEDVRARFREALERKKAGGAGGGGGGTGPAHAKASDATESHKTQRTFRRKSGG